MVNLLSQGASKAVRLCKSSRRIRYTSKKSNLWNSRRISTELVKIKGIGRIRARKLYNNGVKTLEDLSKIPVKKLAEIDKIGSTLADNIKSQIRKGR